jgi:hypothetical protein
MRDDRLQILASDASGPLPVCHAEQIECRSVGVNGCGLKCGQGQKTMMNRGFDFAVCWRPVTDQYRIGE